MKIKFIYGKRKFALYLPMRAVVLVLCRIIKKSQGIQKEGFNLKEFKRLLIRTFKSAKKIMRKSEILHVYSKGKTEFSLSF